MLNPGGGVNTELKADTWIKVYSGDPAGSGALLQTIRMPHVVLEAA